MKTIYDELVLLAFEILGFLYVVLFEIGDYLQIALSRGEGQPDQTLGASCNFVVALATWALSSPSVNGPLVLFSGMLVLFSDMMYLSGETIDEELVL